MRIRSHSLPFPLLTVVGIVAVIALSSSDAIKAQTAPWTPPYSMLLTPERALAFVQAADRRLDYVPGEVLVKFREGVTTAAEERALTALRSRPAVSDLRWIGDVALLRDPRELDGTILAAELSSQPEVAYAQPNYIRHTSLTPNDPGYARAQWNLTALDMPRAWDINPGANENLVVAVVDTGVTTVTQSFSFLTWDGLATRSIDVPFGINPDLAGSRLVKPRDFVFWTGPVLDMVGHGTHVSSTIGEDANNGIAEAGIAYRVKLMPLKVCVGFWEVQFVMSASGFGGFVPLDSGGCPSDAIGQSVRYAADNGAKVINLSLGGSEPSAVELDAIKYAVGKGAFVSIAAGNGHDDGNPVVYPAGFAPTIDGVMSVGAVGPSLKRAYYSTTGSQLEISAPGGSDRDGGVGGGLIWQATILPADSDAASVIVPRFDRYAEAPAEGTSMAAPHVAGIAALIMSQGVTSPAAVEALIKKTARDLGTSGRDDEYGYGLIQPRAALFGLGYGR